MPVRRGRLRLLRRNRGQVAAAFVVLVGLVVLLTPPMMNLGEVARLKTATANAADAGALTGASWIASATNEGARMARTMMWFYWGVQTYFFFPYCLQMIWWPEGVILIMRRVMQEMRALANYKMNNLFRIGRGATLLTALRNASIDDTSGDVAAQINALGDQIKASDPRTAPPSATYTWTREGIVDEPSSVQVDVTYPPDSNIPELVLGGFPLVYWFWVPWPCWLFCFPAYGWNGAADLPDSYGFPPPEVILLAAGAGYENAAWAIFAIALISRIISRSLNLKTFGFCGYLTLFPAVRWKNAMRPSNITFANGTVSVTVNRQRQSGAQVNAWSMNYPSVTSSATAEYGGAHIRLSPFRAGDRAVVDLRTVR